MARMTLTPGFDYGNYHVRSLLGTGAMAEVYLATDRRTGVDVALKVLPRGFADADARLQRFEREARAMTALTDDTHSNVVAVYEVGRHNRTPFIAMEHVDGPTLRELLDAGPLDPNVALDLARQLAGGLQEAHDRGIVHRDLKPDNVMINSDGVLKILDFGLSKPLASRKRSQPAAPYDADNDDTCESLTLPGTILGTLEYMSPEQANGLRVDFRADQFAFGAILYEMLTGKVAFRGETASHVLAGVIQGEPDPMGSDVSEPLREIVERCLRKKPEDRFDSAGALRSALSALVTRAPIAATGASWLAIGGVVLAVVALVMAG